MKPGAPLTKVAERIGVCPKCDHAIHIGTLLVWSPLRLTWLHKECP